MKNIICTKDSYLLWKNIKIVDVPLYDELNPWNVIKECKLQDNKDLWKKLLVYCPELLGYDSEIKNQSIPKDREFFFNVLNTINPGFMGKIVYNANMARVKKTDIPDEIKVLPEFRDIFTSEYSLLGS